MKKALVVLVFAGSIFLAIGHPFVTNGGGILGNGETEVELSAGTDFVGEGIGMVGLNLSYGIGDRFQIGMENFWYGKKDNHSDHGFLTPDVTMKFSIMPEMFAVKATSSLNGESFGGFLLYTMKMRKMEIDLNLDLGFVSNGSGEDAFAWAYSIVKPINSWFVGAEIYGETADWMENDDRNPLWQIGGGYTFTKMRRPLTASIGFGGSFVTNDDLNITLGFTRVMGGE